ncbi:MAG: M3 family oligoendopeptidase [Rhodospirillales bacterium]|nr:M3 family oligoendopeptidase [Rhodospirillales bacterium]
MTLGAVDDGAGEGPPTWRLGDLYTAIDAPDLDADLDWARAEAATLRTNCAGKLASMSGAELADAIETYERICERSQKPLTYAQLVFAEDMSDPERGRFLQNMQERYNTISMETLFLGLELNRIDDAVLAEQLKDPRAARYKSWIEDSRLLREHQLSDELEAILHEKWVTGRAAWTRLFEQTLARMRFPINGDRLTLPDVLNRLSSSDEQERRAAGKAIGGELGKKIELFALITNTLAKDKEIEDRWRRYPNPISHRNRINRIEDEVVEALAGSIQSAYDELAHRYYRLKAGWFGKDALDYWDRNAPLPDGTERRFSWEEARETVLQAFRGFHPSMADIASDFFTERWIHALPQAGKDGGAFSHPAVPSAHPYILMNFFGRPRDVTTLAHELGHGVHQRVAAKQGVLMAETPLTLAETASVFGEMLVFQAVLDGENDPAVRRRLLAGKVEDMLNTVVRQIAFHDFETRVHMERRGGELSADRLGEIWLTVQSESLGPAIRFDDEYRHYWAYIPHFIQSPFYVYAYAFGDCLVNSLYRVFSEGHPGFQDAYLDMLRAGGTLRHRDLLRPFGLDAGDPGFWRRGIDVIVGFIDQLEALE